MSNVNFQKGLEENLDSVAIQDGTIYFTTDTSNLFIDIESNRKQINADKANALTVNAGSTGQPVYFANGVPVATTLANLFAAGDTVLSSYQYGDTLPSEAPAGKIFFLKLT